MSNGLIFKGFRSKDLGLTMKSNSRLILPNATQSYVQVSKRAGAIDFGTDTYGMGEIAVTFSWLSANSRELVFKNEEITGWLHNDGKYHDLIFEDNPERKYKAKVVSMVSMERQYCKGQVQVSFQVNPPHAFSLDNRPITPESIEEQLLWDTAKREKNQYVQVFDKAGHMRITLTGKTENKPTIILVGYIPPNLTLRHKNMSWEYTDYMRWDGIKIDCDKETVTRLSDGYNLFPQVSEEHNDFFIFEPGKIELLVEGNVKGFPVNMSIIVNLQPAY